MNEKSVSEFFKYLQKQLFWFGVINLIAGTKLIISFFIPGLRTRGELILSGILLIIYYFKIWRTRTQIAVYNDVE